MPSPLKTRALPPTSLLARHLAPGDYADCLTVDVPGAVELTTYVEAFYTSPAFRPEQLVLHLIGKGSARADVLALADGTAKNFAAWDVEARTDDEVLLRDFQHRTRSWLMVEDATPANGLPTGPARTRLYFGSGVGRSGHNAGGGGSNKGWLGKAVFSVLLPFHRFYAKLLLNSAARGCLRN